MHDERPPLVDGLVSIVMPSWNTAAFIAESIQSVLDQTYDQWELIIVDDGSTDNTDEVVASFRDSRIKYLKNPRNVGAALTRNRALREARGEWMAFLDSDDFWSPGKLERQLAFMKEGGHVFSYHEYLKSNADDPAQNRLVSGPRVVTRSMIYRYDYIGHLTMMYSARAFGLVQIRDIPKNNDYALRLQLFKHEGVRCVLLPENLATYRIRGRSISHDKFSKKFASHYALFHGCDGKPPPLALWLACRNMGYGLLKKIMYERAACP
jgi:glycosyltransferase involved in cell wall biosynthesis